MTGQKTELLDPDKRGIDQAATLLSAGLLVAFPTETVYGLGADATNGRAVAKIFAAKNRPQFNPLIVHVASAERARDFAIFNPVADRLAAAFWPGPLTLVLPTAPNCPLSELVTAGLSSVAIRVPQHELAQKLLRRFGGPIAAPSANPSGRISPTEPSHVLTGLDGRIAAIVDGGHCTVGLESTIVGLINEPTLLRPGGLPVEAIENCLPQTLAIRDKQSDPNAPGQLPSHYAPRGSIRLNASEAKTDETLLGFGQMDSDLNLSPSGDLLEAAAKLFGALHELDSRGAGKIAVAPIPDHGLGLAINDRLTRAAAPRKSQ